MSKCVILIGSSQNGKSTLGNYLVNGHCDPPHKFQIGSGSSSCTTVPQVASVMWPWGGRQEEIKIIDTAGSGDTSGAGKEVNNMVAMYRVLAKVSSISYVVLVVRYTTLLSAEYKADLLFYKNLFPEMFESRRVIIVGTCWSSCPRWQRKEERSGVSLSEKRNNFKKEFRSILGLNYELEFHTIDCLGATEDPIDTDNANKVRSTLFNKCFEEKSMEMSVAQFPKPTPWVTSDTQNIQVLQASRRGYSSQIQNKQSQLEKTADSLSKANSSLETEKNLRLKSAAKIKEYDTDEEVYLDAREGHADYNMWRCTTVRIEYSSKYPITRRTVSTGNYRLEM